MEIEIEENQYIQFSKIAKSSEGMSRKISDRIVCERSAKNKRYVY